MDQQESSSRRLSQTTRPSTEQQTHQAITSYNSQTKDFSENVAKVDNGTIKTKRQDKQ